MLRKRLSVFGHNAPHRTRILGGSSDWGFTLSLDGGNRIDLDGSHPDVVPACSSCSPRPASRLGSGRCPSVLEPSRYAISGKVTRITLTGGTGFSSFAGRVRTTTVYAVNEPLDFADALDASAVANDQFFVETDVGAMQPGRRLLVRGTTRTAPRTPSRRS